MTDLPTREPTKTYTWECQRCGHTVRQPRTPTQCEQCAGPFFLSPEAPWTWGERALRGGALFLGGAGLSAAWFWLLTWF
jgi:hypothetical protein